METTVTSVDIGDVNLAVAVVSGRRSPDGTVTCTPKALRLIDIGGPDSDRLADALADPTFHDVDAVVIEQQLRHADSMPGKAVSARAHNTRMVLLASAVRQHFLTTRTLNRAPRPSSVSYISAASKLNLLTLPVHPVTYKRYADPKATRKAVSVAIATALLANHELSDYVAGLPKKDDVCDAYLQARAYLERTLADPKVLKAGRAKWSSEDHRFVRGGENLVPVPARSRRTVPHTCPPTSTEPVIFE